MKVQSQTMKFLQKTSSDLQTIGCQILPWMKVMPVLSGISYLILTSLTIIVQSNAKAWHFYFSPNVCKWNCDQHKVNDLNVISYVIF